MDEEFDGTPFFEWTPSEEERSAINSRYGDCAESYTVVRQPRTPEGIMVYGKYHGKWSANPMNLRPLIVHLLQRLGEL